MVGRGGGLSLVVIEKNFDVCASFVLFDRHTEKLSSK